MSIKYLLPLGALLLGACATITEESRSSIVVDGEVYELRTRTIDTGGRTYVKTDAMVGGFAVTCIPSSPGDCEAAVRNGLNRFDDRPF